ncbi:hypothetical protein BJX99DRAFT_265071 [Aspergillus californicus]
MSQALFIEFHLLQPAPSASADRTCAALLSPGKDRCEQVPSLGSASELQELLNKLHHNDEIDTPRRVHILEQIAMCCLCEVHGSKHMVAAAALQWENDRQSRVRHTEPQTPMTKNIHDGDQITFTDYTSPNSKIDVSDPRVVDIRVRKILAGDIKNKDKAASYLYVFSYEGGKGKYKIGRSQDLDRRLEEHEKCYPGLKLHCFVQCPGAYLFERVVHEEFLRYRRRHVCVNCEKEHVKKEHIEWFGADLEDILDSVTAWSLYSRMFHRHGLALDGKYQNSPTPGWLSRPDRWRRWALEETSRWMDGESLPVRVIPDTCTPVRTVETDPISESKSDVASVFSTPGSVSDTPGTTPATTPGSFPGDECEDYTFSPTPAGRYTAPDLGAILPEDEEDWDNKPKKRVERVLFPGSKIKAEDPQSAEERSTAGLETNSVPGAPSTDIHLSTPNDYEIRGFLANIAGSPKNPGTIYLTDSHPLTKCHKIYYRGERKPRATACYSRPQPTLKVECTSPQRIQQLVLAEFNGRIQKDTCGSGTCSINHGSWINATKEDIEASILCWAALVRVGFEVADIPEKNFSQDPDRWRTWASETAAKHEKRRHGKTLGEHLLTFLTGYLDGPRPT